MSVSRRSVIASALAASAAIGGVSAAQQATAASGPRRRVNPGPFASPPGDVVGKITVGYQGWFACIGDGAPINSWW
ncbi:xylosidase, partial [Streptomyces sp. AK02-01A]|nr:xylosidase [Streptomyces sp. AK02-01A]